MDTELKCIGNNVCLTDTKLKCIGNYVCLMDIELSAYETMSVLWTQNSLHTKQCLSDGHRAQCIRNNVCLMDTELSAYETMSVGCTKKSVHRKCLSDGQNSLHTKHCLSDGHRTHCIRNIVCLMDTELTADM
jgi:hypothetical protein